MAIYSSLAPEKTMTGECREGASWAKDGRFAGVM